MSEAKPRLLIVDDEPSIRSSMSQVLSEVGYQVRTAADGRAALAEIRSDLPEVVISDLNMPGMSGFELLPLVRREFPRIRLVAMSSAFSGEEIPLGAPADAFYAKGTGVADLLRIIESFAAQPPIARRLADLRAPIWIARNGYNSEGEAFVTIECPECLGTFPQPLDGAIDSTLETQCVFCGSSIRYAVMCPPDPAGPKPFEHRQSRPKHVLRTQQKNIQ